LTDELLFDECGCRGLRARGIDDSNTRVEFVSCCV
jgi:hypothetical protein